MHEIDILEKILLAAGKLQVEPVVQKGVVTLTIAAPKASDAPPPKDPKIHPPSRLPYLVEAAAQIAPTKQIAQERINTGRFPR